MLKTGVVAIVVILLSILVVSAYSSSAYGRPVVETGLQSYWVFYPELGILFLSVRGWALPQLGLSFGLGEAVRPGNTAPSFDFKALWRIGSLGTTSLHAGALLLLTYYMDKALLPHFSSTNVIGTIEIEMELSALRVSLGIGSPIGWGTFATAFTVGFHMAW